ncbi:MULTISPECIES: lantibiotic immunity ABC transporter MutE/EpiE family permease subunit [Clostridium]|jgi:lantibiotic transport system permease protein|uniref:ABC-2 family transporter protein n=1 Tax=Clostridium thermopalmarium DSM 5974 TaxID=1121340 RepID=A0A2T0AKN1_9CLOT|nr:lantibiotic immunity ABC transporter MutE/EpiE family permease subunit [Clostridium thermopalmarium]PRR69136.1 ABC-2 family transporter protein [Clostridium thermopalmarium DSM 5974]PVZ26513.1 ABC-2 type transport system permease protein [Clostridium thermopalmarium DSM 5974]
MINYLKAENIKYKRTFAKKLVFIAPMFMVLLAGISGIYFVQDGYNWWYTTILPGFITLMTALVNQIEEKKLHYRTVFVLPVSLQKIWISKVLLISFYVLAASLIHLLGIILGKFLINPTSSIAVSQMVVATIILIIVSLWQIPFCLFLSKKFGLMVAVLVNAAIGIALDIFAATESFWWACPYSWGTRLMCPVLGVLPNGTLALKGDALLNWNVVPVGIILAIVMFLLLLVMTARWFQKQEVM